MEIIVRILPLAEREVRGAWALVERMTWELGETELSALSELGMHRRRVWVVREVTGPWLYDVIEGTEELALRGPEAVWAAAASSLDHWIAQRLDRAVVGDDWNIPDASPAVDLRVPLPIT